MPIVSVVWFAPDGRIENGVKHAVNLETECGEETLAIRTSAREAQEIASRAIFDHGAEVGYGVDPYGADEVMGCFTFRSSTTGFR